jgi:hypothetical protein
MDKPQNMKHCGLVGGHFAFHFVSISVGFVSNFLDPELISRILTWTEGNVPSVQLYEHR